MIETLVPTELASHQCSFASAALPSCGREPRVESAIRHQRLPGADGGCRRVFSKCTILPIRMKEDGSTSAKGCLPAESPTNAPTFVSGHEKIGQGKALGLSGSLKGKCILKFDEVVSLGVAPISRTDQVGGARRLGDAQERIRDRNQVLERTQRIATVVAQPRMTEAVAAARRRFDPYRTLPRRAPQMTMTKQATQPQSSSWRA